MKNFFFGLVFSLGAGCFVAVLMIAGHGHNPAEFSKVPGLLLAGSVLMALGGGAIIWFRPRGRRELAGDYD